MRCLGRLIGLGLVLLLMVIFPCSLWTFNIQRIMLNSDTYKNAFKDDDFYQDILPGVLPALLEDLENQASTPENTVTLLRVIQHLDQRDWEQIAPQLVPPDWVKYAVEKNLDAFLAWLDGEVSDLEIVFQTEALRRRLAGPNGDQAVQMIAIALPICSPDEQDQLEAYTSDPENSVFPYCQPERPDLRDSLLTVLNDARLEAAEDLPIDIDVITEMHAAASEEVGEGQRNPFSEAELDQFRSGIRLWKSLLPLTLMIPLALLSLIVMFAVRSWKNFFRWMGWPLIIGCMFTLVPLFFLPFLAPDLNFEAELEGGFSTGGALIAEVVSNRMVELMIGQFTWPILIQSAVLLVLGFVLTVISFLLPDTETPPEPPISSAYATIPVYQTPTGELRLADTPPQATTPPPGSPQA